MTNRKPFRCRLGFHTPFNNTFGVNIGTEKTPIYIMQTERRCNDCDWKSV